MVTVKTLMVGSFGQAKRTSSCSEYSIQCSFHNLSIFPREIFQMILVVK